MEAFATVEDYELRQGPLDGGDLARCGALLDDASASMRSRFRAFHGRDYEPRASAEFDDNAKAVCVAVVARSMCVPDALSGVAQYSQTAGPYSASATYSNPSGDLYLTKSDLRALGLAGTRLRSIGAMTAADREGDGS